jgi:hypothetical protein
MRAATARVLTSPGRRKSISGCSLPIEVVGHCDYAAWVRFPDIHYSPGTFLRLPARSACYPAIRFRVGSQQARSTLSQHDSSGTWILANHLAINKLPWFLATVFIPLLAVQSRLFIVLPLPR